MISGWHKDNMYALRYWHERGNIWLILTLKNDNDPFIDLKKEM